MGADDDLERLAASVVAFGFDGHARLTDGDAAGEVQLPAHAERMIDRGCAVCVLFSRNVEDASTSAAKGDWEALCAALKRRAWPNKLALAVDQEGGRVRRLRHGTLADTPSAEVLGRVVEDEIVAADGKPEGKSKGMRTIGHHAIATASELRAVHIDWNLAPCADIASNPDGPIAKSGRSFSSKPEVVARCCQVFVHHHQSNGVACCAKHFPGIGACAEDTHVALPLLPPPHSYHEYAKAGAFGVDRRIPGARAGRTCGEFPVPFYPFCIASDADVAAIMVSHAAMGWDGVTPASMSFTVVTSLLKGIRTKGVTLPSPFNRDWPGVRGVSKKFSGLVCCDDLEMGGALKATGGSVGDAAVRSIKAGCDLLLVCHTERAQAEAIDAIVKAARESRYVRSRLEDAANRVAAFVEAWAEEVPPRTAAEATRVAVIAGNAEDRARVKAILLSAGGNA